MASNSDSRNSGGRRFGDGGDDTGRRIVAALPAELRDRFESSILGRDDVDVRHFIDPHLAVELVHRSPPALLLLYDTGLGDLDSLMPAVKQAMMASRFGVIVLSEFVDDEVSDWVSATLPVDVDPSDLSIAIAKVLDLPARAGRRYLIKVGVELDNPASFQATGNTVDISASGMLIECNKRLRIGDVYQVSIMGVGDAPELSMRIVREAEAAHPNLHRYGGAFEDVELDVVEALIRRLAR